MRSCILFIIGTAFSIQCLAAGSIRSKIIQNNPKIVRSYASSLAASIAINCKNFNVNAKVMQAILMLESGYKLGSYNRYSKDYGVGQISLYNIHAYNIDVMRLMFDLNYSVYWSVKVFSWFYHRYPLNEAIKRYNCGTRKSCVNWKSVRRYLRLVYKYM